MDLDPVEPMERVGIFPFLLLADTLTLLQSAGQVMPTYPHLILKCPPPPPPGLCYGKCVQITDVWLSQSCLPY